MDVPVPTRLAAGAIALAAAASASATAALRVVVDPLLACAVGACAVLAAALLARRGVARYVDRAVEATRRSVDAPIAELRAENQQLATENHELRRSNQVLAQLSITDGLTQLHNHRSFQDHLTREIKRVNRVREPLSLLVIDIDDFKSLNDRFGHAAGDELLRRLAEIMSDTIRDSDLLARYGGEEFAVLAPDTRLSGAYQLAEKLRTAIAESSFVLDESQRPARVTVSIGVAEYAGNRMRFFEQADRALYCAKAAGKNCVVIGDPDESD